MGRTGIPILACLWLLPFFSLAYFSLGEPEGFVTDQADLLTLEQEERLEEKLVSWQQETSHEIALVTIKSLEGDTIENFTVKLFEEWGIGQKEKDNGLLLLVAKEERSIRIEVGYGLVRPFLFTGRNKGRKQFFSFVLIAHVLIAYDFYLIVRVLNIVCSLLDDCLLPGADMLPLLSDIHQAAAIPVKDGLVKGFPVVRMGDVPEGLGPLLEIPSEQLCHAVFRCHVARVGPGCDYSGTRFQGRNDLADAFACCRCDGNDGFASF